MKRAREESGCSKMSSWDKRKCFTFTWKLENISFNWHKTGEAIRSPAFARNVLKESEYYLRLYLGGFVDENCIDVYLERLSDGPLKKIDCELSFLSKDGAVLKSVRDNNTNRTIGAFLKLQRKEIFVNKSDYLLEDKLIVCCKIWKSDEEMTEDAQCFARTRIGIKKETFLWNIKNFSSLRAEEKCTYQIKSLSDDEVLLTLDLLLKNPYTDEDYINVQLTSETGKIKYYVLHLKPLNVFRNANQGIRKEFLFSEDKNPKLFTLPFSKKDLMENKHLCLSNDVLSFRCECTFSTGDIFEEIESAIYGCENLTSVEPDDQCFDEEIILSVSKRILNDDLKSLFHDNICTDTKLKTNTKTFLAHKSILSARSPVFKAIFSHNWKEKFTDYVEIEDMDSDTVCRLLRYIYTAEIEDLQWESACELYRAGDKYQILALRDECSAYIKSNLHPNKACDILILADMHQDEDLKYSVQEYIFNHDILHSEEWKHLMKTHPKLSADTMYLQIQRNLTGSKLSTIKQLFGMRHPRMNSISSGFESSTNKTTSTSLVLNSSSVSKLFQSSFSLACSNEDESPTPDEFKTANERLPVSSPGLSDSKEVSSCASYEFNNEKDLVYTTASSRIIITFNPPTGTDTMTKGGVSTNILTKFHCISCIKEYENKSLEELRFEDYASHRKGASTIGKIGFGALTQQTSTFSDTATSTFGSPFGGKQLEFFFGTKKIPAEFGMKSAGTPTSPWFENTTSRLNPRNRCIPNKSKGFQFITAQKSTSSLSSLNSKKNESNKTSFLFGEKHFKETFSSGIGSEKVPLNSPSFFDISKNEKETYEIPFSFANSEKASVNAFSSSDRNSKKEHFNIPFSFRSNSEKISVKPFFTSGNIRVKETVKSIPFASSDEKEYIKPIFSFGNLSEKEPVKTSVSYTSSDEKIPDEPCSSFGNKSEKESFKSSFPVSSSEKESVKPCFSIGSSSDKEFVSSSICDEKKSVKPHFSFGNSCEKISAKSPFAFASSDEKEFDKPCFSFFNSSEKEPVKSSFPFVSNDEKESDEPCFPIGNSSEKESEPCFSFGKSEEEPFKLVASSSEKESIKPCFSLGKNEEGPFKLAASSVAKESVKPWFSFRKSEEGPFKLAASSVEKESVKPSFSITSSDDKRSVKQSFASCDEKQQVEQSFASCDEKQQVEQSFASCDEKQQVEQSFDSINEKQHVRQSFASNDEKQHEQSFSSSDEKQHEQSFSSSDEKQHEQSFSSSDEKQHEQSFASSDEKQHVQSFASCIKKQHVQSFDGSDEKQYISF